MCLAVPMKIMSITEDKTSGTVEMGGISREVMLTLLEDCGVGDYVIVHAGFAIEKLDEKEAATRIDLFREMAEKAKFEGLI